MGDLETINEIVPFKGFCYRPRTMIVDAANETRLLSHCGIDPTIYHGCVDPSAFISFAIQEGVRNGISSNGGVNMVQGLVQNRPVRLDESIIVSGEILDVQRSPRGRITTSETWYHSENRELCITCKRKSLKTDPARYADPNLRGAGERPTPIITDVAALKKLGQFRLMPADVKAYGLNTVNAIHFDEDAARRAGYRAPIIGGGHGVRFLTAAIWKEFSPRSINVDIYFRRPLFWDDTFDILVDVADDQWQAMCLAKDGKITTEMRINSMTG